MSRDSTSNTRRNTTVGMFARTHPPCCYYRTSPPMTRLPLILTLTNLHNPPLPSKLIQPLFTQSLVISIRSLSSYRVKSTTTSLGAHRFWRNSQSHHSKWVSMLGLHLDAFKNFDIFVENGEHMRCCGVCLDVILCLGSSSFTIDLNFIPSHGADVL